MKVNNLVFIALAVLLISVTAHEITPRNLSVVKSSLSHGWWSWITD